MSHRNAFRALVYSGIMYGACLIVPTLVYSQESQILILDDAPATLPNEPELPKIASLELSATSIPAPKSTPKAAVSQRATTERSILEERTMEEKITETASEAIRERFKDGRVHIERQVALDSDGNYVNHGTYEEWSQNGDVVCTGTFSMGQRQGPWIRFHNPHDAKLFTTQPYARFKPPFQSSVEFENGQMNGVWVITDADRRVVSQIQLTRGTRNGQSTWFLPNGQVLFQAEYTNGVLNGMFIEKTPEGKVVREELYNEGQRSEVVKEQFTNKSTKSETNYLTASQRVVTQDDWTTVSLASYSTVGERVQHGPYVIYHENGQVNMRGAYDHGIATGMFESWHPNGEKAVVGVYENGLQHGKWSWWHPNGMRQSVATYNQGRVNGEVSAWNDQGKRIVAEAAQGQGVEPVASAPLRVVPIGKQLIR